MFVSPFSVLDAPFGTLVSAFAMSACGWADFPFAVSALGCELGTLASIFSALDFPFGMLDVPFTVLACGWAFFSFAVRELGCE